MSEKYPREDISDSGENRSEVEISKGKIRGQIRRKPRRKNPTIPPTFEVLSEITRETVEAKRRARNEAEKEVEFVEEEDALEKARAILLAKLEETIEKTEVDKS